MFCPFCRRPLIHVQETFHSLEEALLYLVQKYGSEILRNKQNTLQFVECFLPDGKREYNFINMIYASGLIETIYRIRNFPEAIQSSAVGQVTAQFSDRYGISIEWADYVVGCVCKCLGMTNNVDHSIIKIKQRAEENDPEYQFELAECYRTGKMTKRNLKKYFLWLERSAKNGYPVAMYQLGEELWNGSVCGQNPMESVRLLTDAVRLGNRDAVCLIAGNKGIYECCDINIDGYIRDMLGLKNELSAKQLLSLSRYFSDQNDYERFMDLVRLAYEKDKKMAWKDYVKGLQSDNSHENRVIALKVLKEAAIGGNLSACKMLGEQYECEAETANDMMTALYWHRLAAEAGDVDTQFHLAQIYERGNVIQKDMEEAVYWYRIAAYNGSQPARNKVNYKSRDCIVDTLVLVFEDGTEAVFRVEKAVQYLGNDYLIISNSETQEKLVVLYVENNTVEGFEVKEVDEYIENTVLQIYGDETG